MKRETKTVWSAENGAELLVQKDPGKFYIPLSTVEAKTLRELGEAITDALSDELARELRAASKQGKDK